MKSQHVSRENNIYTRQPNGESASTYHQVTLGLWSAVTVTVLNLLFIIGLTIAPPAAWNGTNAYVSSYTTTKLASVVPPFLLVPAIVVLVVSVYCYAAKSDKIFGLMGIVFTTIYAVMGASNYFIQMTTVRQNILGGETAALALFILDNPPLWCWQ